MEQRWEIGEASVRGEATARRCDCQDNRVWLEAESLEAEGGLARLEDVTYNDWGM
jgi:hypothetical protein